MRAIRCSTLEFSHVSRKLDLDISCIGCSLLVSVFSFKSFFSTFINGKSSTQARQLAFHSDQDCLILSIWFPIFIWVVSCLLYRTELIWAEKAFLFCIYSALRAIRLQSMVYWRCQCNNIYILTLCMVKRLSTGLSCQKSFTSSSQLCKRILF